MSSDAQERSSSARPPWGVQLYTVRDQITADAAATLARVAAIGYTELEVLQGTLPVVAPIARGLGLSIVSVHLDAATSKGEGFEAFVTRARGLGLRDVVVPFVPAADRPATREGLEQLTTRLSRMARVATAAGLRFGYHNHAFEFGTGIDGSRWLDVLMRGTADAGMFLQLDVFWATVAGVDPLAVLRQYAGRIGSLHLKDRDPKVPTTLVEGLVPRTGFVEVGAGSLDFPPILTAARAAGVGHYFVEQDYTSGDPLASLTKSFAYLSGLRTP